MSYKQLRRRPTTPDGIPAAVVNHDERTVTIAVTFEWAEPWALDKCEAGNLVGDVKQVLSERYASWEQIGAVRSALTWEPDEELLVGWEPPAEPEEVQIARRELKWAVNYVTRAVYGGQYTSLPMIAEAAETIRASLAVIDPAEDGDTDDWLAIDREMTLDRAIRETANASTWTVRTLNQACTTALRITRGWDRRAASYREDVTA